MTDRLNNQDGSYKTVLKEAKLKRVHIYDYMYVKAQSNPYV